MSNGFRALSRVGLNTVLAVWVAFSLATNAYSQESVLWTSGLRGSVGPLGALKSPPLWCDEISLILPVRDQTELAVTKLRVLNVPTFVIAAELELRFGIPLACGGNPRRIAVLDQDGRIEPQGSLYITELIEGRMLHKLGVGSLIAANANMSLVVLGRLYSHSVDLLTIDGDLSSMANSNFAEALNKIGSQPSDIVLSNQRDRVIIVSARSSNSVAFLPAPISDIRLHQWSAGLMVELDDLSSVFESPTATHLKQIRIDEPNIVMYAESFPQGHGILVRCPSNKLDNSACEKIELSISWGQNLIDIRGDIAFFLTTGMNERRGCVSFVQFGVYPVRMAHCIFRAPDVSQGFDSWWSGLPAVLSPNGQFVAMLKTISRRREDGDLIYQWEMYRLDRILK